MKFSLPLFLAALAVTCSSMSASAAGTQVASGTKNGCDYIVVLDDYSLQAGLSAIITSVRDEAYDGTTLTLIPGVQYNNQWVDVVAIGNDALADSKVTNLFVPGKLRYIGKRAFKNCLGLQTVDLSGCYQLDYIDDDAFRNCTALSKVTLPQRPATMSFGVFNGCSSLKSITVPEQWAVNASFNNTPLYEMSSLKKVTKNGKNYAQFHIHNHVKYYFNVPGLVPSEVEMRIKVEAYDQEYPVGGIAGTVEIPFDVLNMGGNPFIVYVYSDADNSCAGVLYELDLNPVLEDNAVDDILDDETSAPTEYYTRDGLKVANPTPGHIYITRQGAKTTKTLQK